MLWVGRVFYAGKPTPTYGAVDDQIQATCARGNSGCKTDPWDPTTAQRSGQQHVFVVGSPSLFYHETHEDE